MDFDLPQDIRLLQDTVRKFVERELIPIEMQSMDGPDLKPEVRQRLEAMTRELGLWLLEVPADLGGQDLSLLALAVVNEQLARTIALPPRGPGIFGPEVRSILLSLNPEQKERYLYPVLRGEKATAFAQTEPDAGSDPGGMRTTAVWQRRPLRDQRHQAFYLLMPRVRISCSPWPPPTRRKASRGGLTVFLVDMDTPGVAIAGQTVHMMGDVTYEIALDNVGVPAENRIGNEGDGMKAAQTWIDAEPGQPGCARPRRCCTLP